MSEQTERGAERSAIEALKRRVEELEYAVGLLATTLVWARLAAEDEELWRLAGNAPAKG